jgi:hypothetical protein
VDLLGPLDYARLKLPLLLAESTTVMLGYGLGDINVRVAMAWAESFSDRGDLDPERWQGVVVQALYKNQIMDTSIQEPYPGPNGEVVLEICDIAAFLHEIVAARQTLEEAVAQQTEMVRVFLADPGNAATVPYDTASRIRFVELLSTAQQFARPSELITFLSAVLDPVWAEAREDAGFRYYDVYLRVILDIAEGIDTERAHTTLIAYIAEALDRLGSFLDPRKLLGSAFDATDTWLASHGRLGDALKGELRSLARNRLMSGLKRALDIADGIWP